MEKAGEKISSYQIEVVANVLW